MESPEERGSIQDMDGFLLIRIVSFLEVKEWHLIFFLNRSLLFFGCEALDISLCPTEVLGCIISCVVHSRSWDLWKCLLTQRALLHRNFNSQAFFIGLKTACQQGYYPFAEEIMKTIDKYDTRFDYAQNNNILYYTALHNEAYDIADLLFNSYPEVPRRISTAEEAMVLYRKLSDQLWIEKRMREKYDQIIRTPIQYTRNRGFNPKANPVTKPAVTIGTRINCCDNTGAKVLQVIGVQGKRGGKLVSASVGDMIKVVVKEGTDQWKEEKKRMRAQKKLRKHKLQLSEKAKKNGGTHWAVIVRQKNPWRRSDGFWMTCEDNAAVLVDEQGRMLGNCTYGPIALESWRAWPTLQKNGTRGSPF